MKLLSGDQLQQIETHLSKLLARIFAADGLAPVNNMIRRYVLSGGKRIRPQLCVWTFQNSVEPTPGQSVFAPPRIRSADGIESGADFDELSRVARIRSASACDTLPTSLLDVACAWELFHAFLLAHDDIIDNADTRRDQPSLHRQLAALDGKTRQFGVNLGIVAGDLMFSAAMQLWHDIDLPADVYRQELKLFSRIACMTGFGQAIDICQSHGELDAVDEDLLLKEYHWKTAAYTFEGPMLSAAILAGVSEDAQASLSRFALALGQAYQLQNDLLDLSQPAHDGGDLVQGKRTVTLIRARSAMPEKRRAGFDRRLSELRHANGESVALAESLRDELRASGAFEQTQTLIDQFMTTAERAAADPVLPASLSATMTALLDSLRTQYFTRV